MMEQSSPVSSPVADMSSNDYSRPRSRSRRACQACAAAKTKCIVSPERTDICERFVLLFSKCCRKSLTPENLLNQLDAVDLP
jgi:hypothetical protein